MLLDKKRLFILYFNKIIIEKHPSGIHNLFHKTKQIIFWSISKTNTLFSLGTHPMSSSTLSRPPSPCLPWKCFSPRCSSSWRAPRMARYATSWQSPTPSTTAPAWCKTWSWCSTAAMRSCMLGTNKLVSSLQPRPF